MRISLDDAIDLAIEALGSLGFWDDEARITADHLLDCELRGLPYSGLARIASVAERLLSTPMKGEEIRVTRESPVSAQLDGGDRIGYVVAQRATTLAVDKALHSGIGAVGANNTWYTGMLSYYAEQIVGEGLVALIASNATPWVAPYGGTEPRFGTNPICFGFPSDGVPVIWDIGISEIIHAQAVLAHRTGMPILEGSAYDADGRPTTDPMAALGGSFVAWGGHRGSGLGLSVQLLGVLAGSPIFPLQLQDFGFFVLALQPELFVEPVQFRADVSAFADAIRRTRPANPNDPVRVPFERSAALRQRRIQDGGIEVDDEVLAIVRALTQPPKGTR